MRVSAIIILLIWGVFVVTLAQRLGPNRTSPPTFLLQPELDEMLFDVGPIDKDHIFYIFCEAEGEPAPSYRWTKNDHELNVEEGEIGRITMEYNKTGGTIFFSELVDDDMGYYQCFAENPFGIAVSRTVYLRRITYNPFQSSSIKQISVREGEPLKLTCIYPEGWPKPQKRWIIEYSDGRESIPAENSRISVDHKGNLLFSYVTQEDGDPDILYTCVVASTARIPPLYQHKNISGDSFSIEVTPADLTAQESKRPPVLESSTGKHKMVKGISAELHCIFSGTPLPHIIWRRYGRPLQNTVRVSVENYNRTVKIQNVSPSDMGEYECIGENELGAVHHKMELELGDKPYFTVQPSDVTVFAGNDVEILCYARGNPPPTLAWLHNGKLISQSEPNPRRIVETNRILINHAIRNDTGNYGCRASNSLGILYEDVAVNVI